MRPFEGWHPWHIREFEQLFDIGDDDECWLWRGRVAANNGQPYFVARKPYSAAKLVYHALVGFDGLTDEQIQWQVRLYSKCGEKLCVNPNHRRLTLTASRKPDPDKRRVVRAPVTATLRPRRRPKVRTTCTKGHDLTRPGSYYEAKNGYRQCKICMAAQQREYRERNKAKLQQAQNERRRRQVENWAQSAEEYLRSL